MKSKLSKTAMGILLIALMAFVWQCTSWLLSATLQVTYSVEADIFSVEDDVGMVKVDLTEDEDWQEHRDEITGIQRILFSSWVINHSDSTAAAQIYISKRCDIEDADSVKALTDLILDGISVPGNDSIYITPQNSHMYLQEPEVLKEFLLEGEACLYWIAKEVPFTLEIPDSVTIVVDFTYAE
ncbi:MAG: hypothetical protein AMJ92_06435 [candidate division Zixibacteria bacterium SM23_81]|nr:MAG: hypothetical protein AMJ92_06435 [candidate division Zixibacteria bacterium SM23_81]